MDWQQRTNQLLQRPQSRLVVLVAIVLLILGAVQANQWAQKSPPMCDLISQCHLRHGDLQRIQVALGESGLDDFRIEGQQLLVPRHQHAKYLKAVSERDALPIDLRQNHAESVVNPLLSRSQQQALTSQRKKRQLREMILRLPFVQQAWLEVDSASASSPFQADRHSAVISIQPEGDQPLTEQHADTLRRMMVGAIAGLGPDQIEIIDLGQGVAYEPVDASKLAANTAAEQQRHNRQRQLNEHITVALKRFAGVHVDVQLTPLYRQPKHPEPAAIVRPHHQRLTAGSNGVASIYDQKQSPQSLAGATERSHSVSVQRASHRRTLSPGQSALYRVAVRVKVPEESLAKVAMSLMLRKPADAWSRGETDSVGQKFESIKPQIEREVASLLPPEWLQASGASPVEVSLQRQPVTVKVDPRIQIAGLIQQYWPSVATLCVGVVLLSLVVRKSSPRGNHPEDGDRNILSMAQGESPSSEEARAAKDKINRLIQEDPDAAARAIEGWIRNAG